MNLVESSCRMSAYWVYPTAVPETSVIQRVGSSGKISTFFLGSNVHEPSAPPMDPIPEPAPDNVH